jgi:hypothetical protein
MPQPREETVTDMIETETDEENRGGPVDETAQLKTGREEENPPYDRIFGKEQGQTGQHQNEKAGE